MGPQRIEPRSPKDQVHNREIAKNVASNPKGLDFFGLPTLNVLSFPANVASRLRFLILKDLILIYLIGAGSPKGWYDF